MTRAVKLPAPDVDERTDDMETRMLYCRGHGHRMLERPVSAARFLEMAQMGYREEVFVCVTQMPGSDTIGCGYSRTVVYDRNSGDIVESETDYANRGYLLKPGAGRLPRAVARVALWARTDADLYRRPKGRRNPR